MHIANYEYYAAIFKGSKTRQTKEWLVRHIKWQNEGICTLVDPHQHTHREGKRERQR